MLLGLLDAGVIDRQAHTQVRWLELFGDLIANTDMHPGNLSFFAQGTRVTGLAPAYELPMLYAPSHGELVQRTFSPPTPKPSDADIWEPARVAAVDFWRAVSTHVLVSEPFQAIAADNAARLEALADVLALLPTY